MTDNFNIDQLAKFSPEERRGYEESLKIMRDNYSVMETKYNKGVKDGEARGLEKGREEGLKKGREEGREEAEAKAHQEKLVNAMNIYSLGVLSLDQIAQSMDLDINELNEYIKDNSTKA